MRKITIPQRDLLLEHLDAVVAVDRHFDRWRNRTRQTLVDIGFLAYDFYGPIPARPTATRITEAGRELLSVLLADYADVLARAADRQDRRNYDRSAFGPPAAPGP